MAVAARRVGEPAEVDRDYLARLIDAISVTLFLVLSVCKELEHTATRLHSIPVKVGICTVLERLTSQSILPGLLVSVSFVRGIEVSKHDDTYCRILVTGETDCPRHVVEQLLSSLADKYYTLGVLVLGSVPDEARNTQGYASLAEGVERLASLGAAVDAGLLDTLQGLLDHLKTRVYAIEDNVATLAANAIRVRDLGSPGRVEVEDPEVEYVVFASGLDYVLMLMVKHRGTPVTVVAGLHVSAKYLKPFLVVYPEGAPDPGILDPDAVVRFLSGWRDATRRVLSRLANSHLLSVSEHAKLWLKVLSKLGDVVLEMP